MRLQAAYDDFIFLPYQGFDQMDQIKAYEKVGGFQAWSKALAMGAESCRSEIMVSQLRDLGFERTALSKLWNISSQQADSMVVFHCAYQIPDDESLHTLIESYPFLFLEGVLITLFSLNILKCEIVLAHHEKTIQDKLIFCLNQLREDSKYKEYMSSLIIKISRVPEVGVWSLGADLLEGLSHQGILQNKPVVSEYKRAIVQNGLTTCALPWITRFGAGAFKNFKGSHGQGTVLITLKGDIEQPGVYEVPVGTPVMSLIDHYGGGIKDGRSIKGLIVNGGYGRLIPASLLVELVLCPFEFLKFGLRLGPASFIVVDESKDMRAILKKGIDHFLKNRNYFSQPETMAVACFNRWLDEYQHRSVLIENQREQASLLAAILRPLIDRHNSSSAFLFGQFIESVIENYLDDLLPVKELNPQMVEVKS